MSKVVNLIILGEPMGKQRPRYSMFNGIVRTYTPQKTINYESLIVHEYNSKYGKQVFGIGEPVKATINAYYGLAKADFGKKGLTKSGKEKMSMGFSTQKVDIDNVVKIVLDALNSICYNDDKQVVELYCSKKWTLDSPRVEITLESAYEIEREKMLC